MCSESSGYESYDVSFSVDDDGGLNVSTWRDDMGQDVINTITIDVAKEYDSIDHDCDGIVSIGKQVEQVNDDYEAAEE